MSARHIIFGVHRALETFQLIFINALHLQKYFKINN